MAISGVTLSASNLGVTAPSGYSAMALAYINTSDSNVYAYYTDATATGNNTMVALRNTANSEITRTLAIKILFMQN